MAIKTLDGIEISAATSHSINKPIKRIESGTHLQITFEFRCLLLPGVYFLNAGILSDSGSGEQFAYRMVDSYMFKVLPDEIEMIRSGIVDLVVDSNIRDIQKDTLLNQTSAVLR